MSTQQFRACILVAASLLAGCGGAASDTQNAIPCSLSTPAGCGGSLQPQAPAPAPGTTPAPVTDPAASAAAISLVFSSNELGSAGLAGSEVLVTALVKSAQNTAVVGAKVEFSADSGLLAAAGAVTDASGKVSATLSTGGSTLNRAIAVSAKAGAQSTSGVVNVTGTRLSFSGPAFLAIGSSADLVATLVDSADRPIAGAMLSATSVNGNLVQPTSKVSDSRGQVQLQLIASKRGNEQINLSAMGANASRAILVGGSDVALTPAVTVDAGGAEMLSEVTVGSCAPVGGNYIIGGAGQAGSVSLNASRGALYQDASCNVLLAGPMAFSGGAFPPVWIKSDNAGVGSIDASVTGGPSGTTKLEFIATLRSTARVNLQADQAVVGSGESSTLIAVVRDGTAANNLVKGATVQFSIVSDPSGGNLLSPFTSVTGSDGVARVVFVGGPADGGKDGTVIQARIADLPAATSVANLTVNKKALSIQFGTGNQLVEYSTAVLQKEFAVFVSDSAGNPMPDVAISASVWPVAYKKGHYEWYMPVLATTNDGVVTFGTGFWRVAAPSTECPNEDVQRKGLYERAYDTNNNGTLEPGIPMSVVASGKTDAMGMTTVTLRYPRDRAAWVKAELTVTGTVAGTESLARNAFWLPALASDLEKEGNAPPGYVSPYGTGACTSAD